jgi:peptidoglycan/xylan/chitin deacetylase (PgdA/CDA1 family)
LKDHFTDVFPSLAAARIQGLFFITTGGLDGRVASVHKSHHLMAGLEFAQYRRALLDRLQADGEPLPDVDPELARLAYPWDLTEVAHLKYLLNYQLTLEVRTRLLDALFAEYIGDEREFAKELYFSSAQAREMQAEGMLIGGHSNGHAPLSGLNDDAQQRDVSTCATRLRGSLQRQDLWPFSYPYGYHNDWTVRCLKATGFDCSFALDSGANRVTQDPYRIRRIDTKDLSF